jgi:hypothetical protein
MAASTTQRSFIRGFSTNNNGRPVNDDVDPKREELKNQLLERERAHFESLPDKDQKYY